MNSEVNNYYRRAQKIEDSVILARNYSKSGDFYSASGELSNASNNYALLSIIVGRISKERPFHKELNEGKKGLANKIKEGYNFKNKMRKELN